MEGAAAKLPQNGYVPKINEAVLVPVDQIEPNPWNPNVMSETDLGRLTRAIRDNGFDEPLQTVRRDGKLVIVGGYHRYLAAKILGFRELPCVVYDWDDRKAMEECVRRNLVRGHLDHDKFAELLASYLKDEKTFDWAKLSEAFACREQDLLKAARSNDDLRAFAEASKSPDSLPDVEVKNEERPSTITKRGDLWELGPHRLMCGDSTNPDDMAKLMGEDRACLLATDPPYGVKYTGKNRPKSEKGKKKIYEGGKNWEAVYDESNIENYEGFLKAVFLNCSRFLLPRTAWYVWHSHTNRAAVESALAAVNVKVHQEIIWVKPSPVLNYSFFPSSHEPAVVAFKEDEPPPAKPEQVSLYIEEHEKAAFGWKKGEKPPHRIDKSRYLTTVWEADFDGKAHLRKSVHPTQKPVVLFEIPMLHHTERGAICLEPFSGSGTQIIAAERTGRVVRAMEISPFFCDLAIRRWQEYSGKRPKCLNRDVEFPR